MTRGSARARAGPSGAQLGARGRRQRSPVRTREIRRRHPELPVLLTARYVEAASDMADGEFDLLLKPYTLEALAEALVDVR